MVFNDKTKRNMAPCKAGRLRHLHGVRILISIVCYGASCIFSNIYISRKDIA